MTEESARKISEDIYFSEHGKKKAQMWVCGFTKLPSGAAVECRECKAVCYYDTRLNISFSKNVKKICVKCAFDNHFYEMTALEQETLNTYAKYKGWNPKKIK
jgi:hypothetical protein